MRALRDWRAWQGAARNFGALAVGAALIEIFHASPSDVLMAGGIGWLACIAIAMRLRLRAGGER